MAQVHGPKGGDNKTQRPTSPGLQPSAPPLPPQALE